MEQEVADKLDDIVESLQQIDAATESTRNARSYMAAIEILFTDLATINEVKATIATLKGEIADRQLALVANNLLLSRLRLDPEEE